MNIWLILYFSLCLIGIGMSIEDHGKEKKGKYNFWISFSAFALVQVPTIQSRCL